MDKDNIYLKRCKELADISASKGNSAVGALIVLDDTIIAEAEEAGFSENDLSRHAEMDAVKIAVKKLNTKDLSNCTLYSTHEPCVMCSYLIRYYGIGKLVYVNAGNYLGGIHSTMNLLVSEDVPPHWPKPPLIKQITDINQL